MLRNLAISRPAHTGTDGARNGSWAIVDEGREEEVLSKLIYKFCLGLSLTRNQVTGLGF